MMRRRVGGPDPGQPELPFASPPGSGGGRIARVLSAAFSGLVERAMRAVAAATVVAASSWRRPVHTAGAAAAFATRWVLRIALPLGGAAMMLHVFPYHATAAGVHFRVEGTIVNRPGLSADTTFGSWEFPHVDGLPIGAHVSPENVDVVTLAAGATRGGGGFADELQADFARQVPRIILWLAGEALIGIGLGLALAAAINLALRYLRRLPWRERELRHRVHQLATVVAVLMVLSLYGQLSYNRHWVKDSRVTGTLGALQLFPDQLQQYYQHQSKAIDVINAIAGIQAQLQRRIEQKESPSTAFNIMFISDMHLGSTYPLVAQYAANFDVRLIISTGDESEFGTKFELTRTYVDQIRAITKTVPMIWLAGNHDSPETIRVMRSIPGVTVLGTKSARPDGTYAVTAQVVAAYGLSIAGLPDPRVYAAAQSSGSNEPAVVHALERKAVDEALVAVGKDEAFDIFATHEPVAAQEAARDLNGRVRETVAGHNHAQNPHDDLRHGQLITLVEGSTGAGGLDYINRGEPPPPVEFSIESVATDCGLTKLVRFQLVGPAPTAAEPVSGGGQEVTASTTYLTPQDLEQARTCAAYLGIGSPVDIGTAG